MHKQGWLSSLRIFLLISAIPLVGARSSDQDAPYPVPARQRKLEPNQDPQFPDWRARQEYAKRVARERFVRLCEETVDHVFRCQRDMKILVEGQQLILDFGGKSPPAEMIVRMIDTLRPLEHDDLWSQEPFTHYLFSKIILDEPLEVHGATVDLPVTFTDSIFGSGANSRDTAVSVEGSKFSQPLRFQRVAFRGAVVVSRSSLASLEFKHVRIDDNLEIKESDLDGRFALMGACILGRTVVAASEIAGSLAVTDAVLHARGAFDAKLFAQEAACAGMPKKQTGFAGNTFFEDGTSTSAFLLDATTVHGPVHLVGNLFMQRLYSMQVLRTRINGRLLIYGNSFADYALLRHNDLELVDVRSNRFDHALRILDNAVARFAAASNVHKYWLEVSGNSVRHGLYLENDWLQRTVIAV